MTKPIQTISGRPVTVTVNLYGPDGDLTIEAVGYGSNVTDAMSLTDTNARRLIKALKRAVRDTGSKVSE